MSDQPKTLLESLRWVPPTEDPDAKYRAQAHRMASDALTDAILTGSSSGGLVKMPRTASAAELKARDVADQAARKALADDVTASNTRLADLDARIAALGPQHAQLGKRLDELQERRAVKQVVGSMREDVLRARRVIKKGRGR